ncbi:MAG: rhomboid family intramembrane serine protease [Rhodospirillales bacterium]|nr:rhomboid family intramembrane serine protease [Rhodospirillales bacterium]
MKANGSNNGHDKDPNEKKIIKFPSLAERDKMRRTERKEEERWRKEYRQRSKAGREPFFNTGNIPPFSRALILSFWIVHLPLYLLVGAPERFEIFQTFGFVPADYTSGIEWHWEALITPLTHAFIHGSWMHLIFNTVMGLVMTMFFEKIFGGKTTAKFFALCVLGGALLYLMLSPSSTMPLIGASGGISGLFAALLYITLTQNAMSPLTQRFGKYGPWPILGFWALFISVPGLLMGQDVAWQAHLGGYLTGIALLIAMQKRKIKL